jgi:16S rRNA (guanine527-N7)-methyltransferase
MDFAAALAPFLGGESLSETQLAQLKQYLDVLLRWNAKINLTSVRDPAQIVTRHFGESLFAARMLLHDSAVGSAADVGSGAGFPGLPIKIYAPALHITLIEAHGRKATFLREVIRALTLTNINVLTSRAEALDATFDLVTLRAVERFDDVLPAAASLVCASGRIGLLIGAAQQSRARQIVPEFSWSEPLPIPQSTSRVLLVGTKRSGQEPQG